MASRIKLLPDHLIDQIAAGEVVERPASILKELLDNSLDAGSTRLEVDFEAGGKKLVRVADDGCGLNKEELFLCLERHATSKINADSDLASISTLGFRGEALPSIGAVARLAIVSSPTPDGPGHRIRLEGGRFLGVEPVPANQGSTVEVKDLFFNVPARRKFLKTEATERAHILDVAQRYALARPDLRLVLKENNKTIFSVEKRQDQKARVAAVMGQNVALSLRPVEYKVEDLQITGWLADPNASSKTGALLFLYVLGRPVKDRLLTKAIIQGYGRALPAGRYPAGVINVDLDPRRVDVNVHPAKTEVRFREPGLIFAALAEVTAKVALAPENSVAFFESSKAPLAPLDDLGAERPNAQDLDSNSLSPPPRITYPAGDPSQPDYGFPNRGDPKGQNKGSRGPNRLPPFVPQDLPKAQPLHPPWMEPEFEVNEPLLNFAPNRPKPNAEDANPAPEPPELAAGVFEPEPKTSASAKEPEPDQDLVHPVTAPEPRLWEPWRDKLIGQLNQSYILVECADGLKIIDQHAAHERILFNQLKEVLADRGLPCQMTLFPETVELSAHQILAVATLNPGLAHLGFELEPFGGQTYLIKGYPEILDSNLARETLLEMLAKAQSRLKYLEGAGLSGILEEMSDAWLDSLACRAAVKAGQRLTRVEMEKLIRDTRKTAAGGYCPHGRPAVTIIPYREIATRFKRT
ncbi:MAG: DNA mismatch repair endonuclease MutL [Deltaproteobacteria bacterium]|jgi:DNA mismatch repair protein MutL|nr:DNA mismatch repair endonuclease MutL [Deltaproteobacteria bacterium]